MQEEKQKYELLLSPEDYVMELEQLERDGVTQEELVRLRQSYVRKRNALIQPLSMYVTQRTTWLWQSFIPKGKVTVVMGDPGEGKTTLMLYLAAMLSKGVYLDGSEGEPRNSIYQTAEDGISDTVCPRLNAMGADRDMIYTIQDSDDPLTFDDNRLEGAINTTHAALAILDPIQAYLGEDVDMHRANEIRPRMKILADIAERTNCAIVLVAHMNKQSGIKAMYKLLGSIDIAAAARSVLLVMKDPNDPDLIVVKQVKNSLAPMQEAIAFRRGENGYALTYEGAYEGDVGELLDGGGKKASPSAAKAEAFLREQLTGTVRPSEEVLERALAEGIKKHLLSAARKRLGVRAWKAKDGKWYMSLPQEQSVEEGQESARI